MSALLLGLLLLCARPGAAEETYFRLRDENKPRSHFLIFGYRHLFSTGGSGWRTEIPTQPANISIGTTENLRTSPGIDILSVEIRPLKRLFFGAEFGTSFAGNGHGDIHYWVNNPHGIAISLNTGYQWFQPQHEDWEAYTTSISGRTTLFSANVYLHILDGKYATFDEGYGHSLDLLFGYTRFEERYDKSNLVRTFSPGTLIPAQPIGPVMGLNSTYQALWQGPHIGIREEVSGPYDFFFEGAGVFSPIMVVSAKGTDSLSEDTGFLLFGTPGTKFTHSAIGMGTEMNVALGWKPFPIWKLQAGYSLYYFWSTGGTSRYTFPDATTQDVHLDWVRTIRSGIFLGSSLLF